MPESNQQGNPTQPSNTAGYQPPRQQTRMMSPDQWNRWQKMQQDWITQENRPRISRDGTVWRPASKAWIPPTGRQFSFWEQPNRVARYYNLIRQAPPDWKPPEWLNPDGIKEAYDYLKFRNNNAPWQEWKALPEDDAGTKFLQSLKSPPYEVRLPSEISPADIQQLNQNPLTDVQVKAQQPIDWYSMPQWQRLWLGLVVPQTENIEGRPEWTRLTASGLQSILMALGVGVGVSAIAGPWVGIPAGLAVAGGLTYQAYTGKKVPVANELMLASNVLSESLEKVFGLGKQASASSLQEVLDELPAAWKAGAATYESGKANYLNQLAGFWNIFTPDEKDSRLAGPNEVWQFERGITEPVKLPEGVTKGREYLDQARNWIDEGNAQDEFNKAVSDEGYTGTYKDFILYRLTNDFGISGVANDLLAQTVLDPLNVLPWMIGKAGSGTFGKISTATKNPTTARVTGMLSEAFKQGTGSLPIEMLPFGIQNIAAALTGQKMSAGLLGTMKIYQDWIRTGTVSHAIKTASADIRARYDELVKAGVDPNSIKVLDDVLTWSDKFGREKSYKGKGVSKIEVPKVEDLSPFEKFIGGIDDVYGLKELRPTSGKSFITKFVSLTPDAQVSHILTAFHHNIATLMDMARGKPEQMVDLIQKLAGMKEIKPGEAGYNIISSPANKAVMAGMAYAMKDGDISANMLGSWVSGAERRSILEKVALAIDTDPKKTTAQKVADTIQRFKDNPEEVSRQLNKIAPDLKTTPDALKEVLKVFVGDDPLPWSAEQFQANLVNAIAKKMDGFFQDKYGLKQDNWIFRASNALKGVQSLVLLGFNPAYFMNNWVNNVVTRAADGIGGYMTNKQVNEFYTRLGIFPRDSGLSMYDDITGAVIRNAREASNDVLSKAQKTINFLNKAGIFSRLSHKIEKLEGSQARVVSMKQYLDSQKVVGKGIRAMDPQIEIMLDQRYPGFKERVYSAVRAGLNMDEIEASLFSTEVRPSVEGIIDDLESRMPGARDILNKTNVTDMLRDELANVKTPEDLTLAVDNVINKLRDKISDQTGREIINNVEVEAKNLTDAERIPYVLKTFGDMVIDNAIRWLTGRTEWMNLYARQAELKASGKWLSEVKRLQRNQKADWERGRNYELNTHKGIISALGIENEHSRAFVNGLGDYHNLWKEYWNKHDKLYDEFYSMRREKGETYEAFGARQDRAYDALQDAQSKLYDETTAREMEIQRRMDAAFASMYAKYTGWDAAGAAKWRADLWEMRQKLIDMQKDMRERTRNMTPADRDAAYAEFNPEYQRSIAAMKQFEHDGAFMLMNKPSDGAKIEIPQPIEPGATNIEQQSGHITFIPASELDPFTGNRITPEVRQAINDEAIRLGVKPSELEGLDPYEIVRLIEEKKKARKMQEISDLGKEKMGAWGSANRNDANKSTANDAAQPAQPVNPVIQRAKEVVRAKLSVEQIYREADDAKRRALIEQNGQIGRNEVEKAFIENFPAAIREQITVTMALFDMVIDRWAVRNGMQPGKAAQDAWYATRIAKVEAGDGTVGKAELDKLDQLMQNERTSTPEFKAWFGDSKVVDADGNPLVVYHGSAYKFDSFNPKYARDGSYGKGFYFAGDTKYAGRYGENVVSEYLNISNPADMQTGLKYKFDTKKMKRAGYDGVVVNNKITGEITYVVFDPTQIKSINNQGTWDRSNPNTLKQGEIPKGSYKLLSDGSAILKGFQAGDVSTMIHEMAHVFRRDLPAADLDVVAQHAGLVNGIELRELEQAFMEGRLVEGTPEYAKYVKAEEDFARGWERYLAEGDAPTPQMKSVFRQFTDWMLNIYDKLRRAGSKVLGFEDTKLNVDITTKVNGQSLKDVFDRMLVDKPNRTKSFAELAADKYERVKNTGRNHKFSDTDLNTMAHRELVKDILGRFASEEEARAYMAGMTDYETINGSLIDDATMNEALNYVTANPEVNPWTVVATKKVAGKKATADTPKGDTINMQYKVIDLDNLEASDNWYGNTVQPNPNYNQELQKRIRGEKSSVAWMMDKAKPEVFNPKSILDEYNSTDRGTPIIVMDNQVWSGNGRVNAVRYSIENNLGAYEKYRASLDEYASRAGIDPESYADMQHPFLVREITDDLTPDQLEGYAADSNKGSSASMSDFENAVNEGARITDESLMTLEVGDTESIEGAIQAARNDTFVKSYLMGFDETALKDISYNLKLTEKGIKRIVNALLAKVYQGASGERLVRIMANGDNSLVKNQLKVLKDTLPQVAVLEGTVKTGQLDAGLKISDDLSVAIDVLDRIRQNPKMNVNEYLNTQQLVKETTPFQDVLIEFLDTAKPTEARQTIRNYVAMALKEPDPRQMDMFGDTPHKVKEEIFNDARTVGKLEGEQIDALIAAGQTSAPTPRLTEQPVDTGAGEGTGGVQRGSEAVPGIPEPEISRPASGEPAAVRQPWEMTRKEFYDHGYVTEAVKPSTPRYGLKGNIGSGMLSVAFQTKDAPRILDAQTTPRVINPYDGSEMFFNTAKEAADYYKELHRNTVRQALSEGKPVPPEVLADYPDLVAKNVITTETKADYDAGKPVPIERASEIDLTHQDTLPVPDDVSELIDNTDMFKFEKKQQASDYVEWVMNGEKGKMPDVSQEVIDTYAGQLDTLREHAAQKARGVTAEEVAPVITVARSYDAFKKGNAPKEVIGLNARDEEMVGYSGEAYSSDYMVKSDETGRNLRWVFVLSDGRQVSADGVIRVTKPDIWEKIKHLPAEKRFKQIWKNLPEEAKVQSWKSLDWDEVFSGIDFSSKRTPDEWLQIADGNLDSYLFKQKHPANGNIDNTARWFVRAEYIKRKLGIDNWYEAKPADVAANTPIDIQHYRFMRERMYELGEIPDQFALPTLGLSKTPGITITKVFAFKHGEVDCVANVYKDGELIAYMPASPIKDMAVEDGVRVLGLDPQFPDRIVYEQDGVIKTVDGKKPEIAKATNEMEWQTTHKVNATVSETRGESFTVSGGDVTVDVYFDGEIYHTNYSPKEGGKRANSITGPRTSSREVAIEWARNIIDQRSTQGSLFQSGQLDMFSQTATDLPLFSGTPMRAEDVAFRPQQASPQMSMFPDVMPEAKPTTLIEISIKGKDGTSYTRFDIRKTKQIRDLLALNEGAEMTARIMDANGKVIESNVDPNTIVKPGGELWQAEEPTRQWYYSQLGKVLETMPNKMTPDALRGFLNGKVKADELQWTGFEKWISEQPGQISKQDALDFIMENQVRVEEVIHGDTEATKFATYTLPGGKNYRELLITLSEPPKDISFEEYLANRKAQNKPVGTREDYTERKRRGNLFGQNKYISPHWSEPNVLAHIRFDDRVDADGKRVLFIEEIQSDWHQAGREGGYQGTIPNGWKVEQVRDMEEGSYYWIARRPDGTIAWNDMTQEGVISQFNYGEGGGNKPPPAPFSKNWEELAVKRAIRYAAENGYDRVAWTTGKMQSDRYKLGNYIDTLEYGHRLDNNRWILRGTKDGNEAVSRIVEDNELEGAVGVEVAKKMRNLEGKVGQYNPTIDYRILENQDLLVESQGMRGFYDEKIPNIIRKYIKKWGSDVGETNISTSRYHQEKGFPEFERWLQDNEITGIVARDEWYAYPRSKLVNSFFSDTGEYDLPVQSFDITPAMRDSVVYQGQPLFQTAEPTNTAPMGKVPLNGTPVTEPFGRALDELYTEKIRPLLSDFEASYKERMGDKAFNWGDVSDADRKTVRQYLNGTVANDLAEVKRAALTYGDSMRNASMLDYSRRYGFDNFLNIIAPYQFWYTRSMVNWSKRMIDKPAWFAMYARLQQAQERMEREGMPSRLKGKARFNMAWMPEWMGGGLWTDPMNKIFPFDQFGQPFEQFSNNQTMVYRRAEQVIDDMRTAEKITSEQANIALDTQTGDVWDQAVNQAEMELDKSASPMSLPTMMLQPALWWTMANNAIKGTPEKNSVLPITRTGQTLKELGKDTFFEGATDLIGGLLAGPETAIRKNAGLSEFGQWGDYYIDRTLAGMAADGEISAEDARIAMIERQGEAFQEAYSRVQTEQALRTPGAPGLMAFKETVKNKEGIGTVAGQTLASSIAGLFGGSLFSEGELKMRGLKPIYDNAWRKFDAGDEDALNQFFEDYPEYYARLALYDEPEQRLHQFLVDSIWRKYMALDKENKYLARETLGDEFMDSFLNKETRAYDAISDETLAQWSQMLGTSKLPDVEGTQGAQGTQPMELYDQDTISAINAYKAEKDRRFPNVGMWQEQYFALPPGAQRKALLQQRPELKNYWDWKDAYSEQHPEIVPYFEELKSNSAGDQASSEITSPLVRQLLSYATGGQLTGGAKAELERIRKMYAPNMSEEEFTAMMIQLILSGQ